MKTARREYAAFILACAVVAVILGMRAWRIRALWNAQERKEVQASLQAIVDERGWLLSDMEIVSIQNGVVKLNHRSHILGQDPSACFVMTMSTRSLAPCAAKI